MANQNRYFDKEIKSDYSGVNQCGLVVFLQAAFELEPKTPAKAQAIEQEVAEKLWPEVSQLVFNCMEDVGAACKHLTNADSITRQVQKLPRSQITLIPGIHLLELNPMWLDMPLQVASKSSPRRGGY